MKQITKALSLLLTLTMLAACGRQKGDISHVEIVPATSSFFTEREIAEAENTLMDVFKAEYPNYTLVKLWYASDMDTLENSNSEGRAIVLYTDIQRKTEVTTEDLPARYYPYRWVLVENDSGKWSVVRHESTLEVSTTSNMEQRVN